MGLEQFDAAVIGAGVVGLAIARELGRSGWQTVVIERHGRNGQETSSRNSGVIHAGMYYPPGSIKAELCFSSNQKLYDYCEKKGVLHAKIGKFIVAVNSAENEELHKILERGHANGVPGLQMVKGDKVIEKNEGVTAWAAIYSPHTGIIDPHSLMDALEEDASEAGVIFAYGHSVEHAERTPTTYTLAVRCGSDTEKIKARCVINAAGLDADKVFDSVGGNSGVAGYKLHYCRGHYFRLSSRYTGKFQNLIYPVPQKNLTGLGVHVTVDLAGNARLGPDTEYLAERAQNYAVSESLRTKFFEAVRWYLPQVREEDLSPDYAGIRPKLQGPNDPYRDFVIQEESGRGFPGWVNLIGIESPGLTCCLGIAERVARLLKPFQQ